MSLRYPTTKETSGVWDVVEAYSALHDKQMGRSCGCSICEAYGSLDWNHKPDLQAEKAKEEKVEQKIEINNFDVFSSNPKAFIPLSEAVRIAQLPEVVAEVERQRKEREIKVGDAVYDNEYNRWFVVDHISDGIAFSKTGKDGVCCFGGLSALVKVTDEEMRVMEGIKARHVWTAAK